MIKLRNFLSKDNFWNLMFWLGMVIGSTLTQVLELPILLWITILGVPYIIVKFNKVSLNSEQLLVNSEGKSLNDRYPTKFVIVVLGSILFSVITCLILDKNMPHSNLPFGVFIGITLLPFTLYFIFKNCPIAILFNKNAWKEEVIGISFKNGTNSLYIASVSSSSKRNPITDFSFRHLGGNIHNHRRFDR